jgi:hypothetical protein
MRCCLDAIILPYNTLYAALPPTPNHVPYTVHFDAAYRGLPWHFIAFMNLTVGDGGSCVLERSATLVCWLSIKAQSRLPPAHVRWVAWGALALGRARITGYPMRSSFVQRYLV